MTLPVYPCLRVSRPTTRSGVAVTALLLTSVAWAGASDITSRPFAALAPAATIRVGKTADWVVVTPDAVWVGSTGPNAVHRIDRGTNTRTETVRLPGAPCAGMAVGDGSLWVPLCAHPNRLARVDLLHRRLTALYRVGPAANEGGIATSPGSVWMITDTHGTLARIDASTGRIRQRIPLPAGSFNPAYADGIVWVTRALGAEVTAVDAMSGAVLGRTATGPGPRFLAVAPGALWTLNQGDGSLTRIDAVTRRVEWTSALGTPGHGGDIAVGAGVVWTTVAKTPLTATDARTGEVRWQWVGPGGDSLAVADDAVWITDYDGGTIARLPLPTLLATPAPAPTPTPTPR